MSYPGHPLHGNEFALLGQQECKDGLYFKVILLDESVSYLPAK
jgi:hypothetical protein